MDEEAQKKYVEKIRATYKESKDIEDIDITTQLEFAEILVEQDIEDGNLKEKLKDMGIVYLTSHYLYLNYSKTKKDSIQNFTGKERALGALGKGYEASPYGQQYILISNKKEADSSKESASSGVVFL